MPIAHCWETNSQPLINFNVASLPNEEMAFAWEERDFGVESGETGRIAEPSCRDNMGSLENCDKVGIVVAALKFVPFLLERHSCESIGKGGRELADVELNSNLSSLRTHHHGSFDVEGKYQGRDVDAG